MGFNLIEAAIVLAVVGLVVGGIWVAAAMFRERQKVSELHAAVLTMSDRMRGLWRQQIPASTDWDNVTTAMSNAGVVPANYLMGGSPKTPYGSVSVWVAASAPLGPGTPEFLFQFAGIPVSVCIDMTTWANANWQRLNIHRVRPSSSSDVIPLPSSISTIATVCEQAAATADVYSLVFGID